MHFSKPAVFKSSFFQSAINNLLLVVVPAALACLTGCGGGSMSANRNLPSASTPVSTTNASTPTTSANTTSATTSSATTSATNSTATPNTSPSIPANAKVSSAIQGMNNWQWCTADLNGKPCASGLGNATSSMSPNQPNPSVSGGSSLFTLGGPTQYSNALWWRELGADDQPTHFVYDLYFFIDNAAAPEALEFDVNQSFGGVRYTWGSECSYKNTGKWDIWDPAKEAWVTTKAPCPSVASGQWHHLVWQLERVNGQVHYISVTVDNNVMPVDLYFYPQGNYGGDGVNVAFQMDGDYKQTPYKVWLDKVTLSRW